MNKEHTCTCNEGTCSCHENDIYKQMSRLNVGGTEYHVSSEELCHFVTLPIDTENPNWEDDLVKSEDYDTLINAYFTLSRIDDAWNIISNHKEKINFDTVCGANPDKPSPFFQIKRDAQDVYKYMYDNGIIDDTSYAYFQVIGGKLTNDDFWKKYFEGKSVSERLEMIHDAYNGNNPFELGLVVLNADGSNGYKLVFGENADPNEYDISNSDIAEDELLDDYILGRHPGVFFDDKMIYQLIYSKKLKAINYPKYMSIILQMYIADYSDNWDERDKEKLSTFWEGCYELLSTRIREINVDSREAMESFIESTICVDICKSIIMPKLYNDNTSDEYNEIIDRDINRSKNIIHSILINSLEFMNYPYRTLKLLKDSTGYEIKKNDIDASECIMEKNYSYLLSYNLLDVVDCSQFIIKYPFPGGMNCIYDKRDNIVFINGEVKPFDEGDIEEFEPAFEYEQTGEVPTDFATRFESVENAEEICISMLNFYKDIQEFLG